MPLLKIKVIERVVYQITVFVPPDATTEEIVELAEKSWTEDGDPVSDFLTVEERDFDWDDDFPDPGANAVRDLLAKDH